ncbi:hypothetical protein VTN31DRAFT_6185 [Thermomyces dupontii]|uniref:uncharacterized protein n=1 Tax=Talaromyces thermophilus TaxID=28565 RepID=UPI003744153E
MASPKVFGTGATGYIGGDALYVLYNKHPEWQYTTLVRTEEKAKQLTAKFPNISVVYGSLDVLEEESKKADIIYHFADCDHVPSAQAIVKGARAHTADRPVWIIHTSGTGSLIFKDLREKTVGVERDDVYDDWDNVHQVTSLPDDALHRNVDKIILAAGEGNPAVKSAVVAPPCINGPGRGLNPASKQIPIFVQATLKRKKGMVLGEGRNIWHWVHVQDLSELFLALGEAAVAGGGNATWGKDAYYFADNGPFYWGDVQRAVAQAAHEKGYIPTAEVDTLSFDEANEYHPLLSALVGGNSRGTGIRAKKLFGWTPTRSGLLDLIPNIVEEEAHALGMK